MGYYEIKNKDELLSKYSKDYKTLKNVLESLDDEIINFVPELENAWSIKEHIAHLVDTEANGFIRFKRSVLNPGTTLDLGIGDIERSNKILDYASQNIDDLLDLFRLFRKIILDNVKKMSEQDLERYYIEHVNHPTFSRTNLKFILSINTQHFDKHLEFINRNIDLYNKSNI
jgi:hypothetical protein